jgi:hypothetical protein
VPQACPICEHDAKDISVYVAVDYGSNPQLEALLTRTQFEQVIFRQLVR